MNKRIYKKKYTSKSFGISLKNLKRIKGNKKIFRSLVKTGDIKVSRIDVGQDLDSFQNPQKKGRAQFE